MRTTRQSASLTFIALATVLLAADIASGQEHIRRLRSPATVRGFIGSESHDSYVVRAREGQIMTVQISWQRENDKETRDNHAEFFVSESSSFKGDGQVKFGSESNDRKRWSGRILRTGNYFIYVNAHPTAHYTLRVTVK
jgi:hypothetical protein